MIISTYMPTKMGQLLKLQYPFGGFLTFSVSKRVKIHEPPFIDRYLNGSVFLLLGIQMGHYFDSKRKYPILLISITLIKMSNS